MTATLKANDVLPIDISQLEDVQVQDAWWLLMAIIPLSIILIHFFWRRKLLTDLHYANPIVRDASVVINRQWPRHLSAILMSLLILMLVYPAARPVSAIEQTQEKALLIWVYDASESMSTVDVQKDDTLISRLDASVQALEDSLDSIPGDFHKLLVSFAGPEEVTVGLPTLNNAELLKQAHSITQGERTATDYGLERAFAACQQFFNDEDDYPCEVFLLSDGECNPRPQCRMRSTELVAEAANRGIVVHTISWGDPESDYRPNPRDMAELASAGDGIHLASDQIGELTNLYSDVATGMDIEVTYQALASGYAWLARLMIVLLTLIFFMKRLE